MKKSVYFLLLLLGLMFSESGAQTVTVASGISTSRYFPVFGYWLDAPQRSQMLYPESMLTQLQGKRISELTYFFSSPPQGEWGGVQTIKMGITYLSNLQAGFATETLDTVWTGTFSDHVEDGQMHLYLDQPFTYNGGNLVIEFENTTPGTWKDSYFYGQNQSATYAYMTWNTVNTQTAAFLPKLVLMGESGTCLSPRDVSVPEVDSTSARLSWSPNSTSVPTSYTLAYKLSSDSAYTEITTSDTSYLLEGLLVGATYDWQVRANCSDLEQSEWRTGSSFRTVCYSVVPYYCDFENNEENLRWAFESMSGNNQWAVGEATAVSGTHALYISDDFGVSNSYTTTSASGALAYHDVFFDSTYNEYQVSFDFKGMGQSGADQLKVFLGPISSPLDAPSTTGATLLGTLHSTSLWTRHVFSIDSTHTGMQRLYLRWDNNNAEGENPPAALDNIAVLPNPCGVPSGLATTDITPNSAVVSWHPAPWGCSGQYVVSCREYGTAAGIEITVSDTTTVLTGLMPAKTYVWKVMPVCSDGTSGLYSSEALFVTWAALPYSTGFEDAYENMNWHFVNGNYATKWYIGTAAHHGGEYGMYISDDGGVTQHHAFANTQIWAYHDFYLDPSYEQYIISFEYNHAHVPANSAKIYLGPPVEPDGSAAPAGATLLAGSLSTDPDEWKPAIFAVDSSHAGLQRLYIQFSHAGNSYHGNNQPMGFDNFLLYGSHCTEPLNPRVVSKDSGTVVLAWEPSFVHNPTTYTIAYRKQSETAFTEVTTTDTFYILTGLDVVTPYVWKIRSQCSGDMGEWSHEMTFVTPAYVYPLPYFCDFEDAVENGYWITPATIGDLRWCVGTALNGDGSHSLYISGDSGLTNSSSLERSGYIWIYRDIYFTPDAQEYQISFDYRGNAHTSVYLGERTSEPTIDNYSPTGAQKIADLGFDTTWTRHVIYLSPTFSGVRRLYFCWNEKHWSTCANDCTPPGAIDNVLVAVTRCGNPVNPASSAITASSATLSWSPKGIGISTGYTVAWRAESDTVFNEVVVADTFLMLSGLSPDVQYIWKVQTHCGTDTSLWSAAATFRTLQIPVGLPYFCDFEDSVENGNWNLGTPTGVNSWYIGDAVNHGGQHSLYISDDGGTTNHFTVDYNYSHTAYAYRDIYFPPGYESYEIVFDFKGIGDSYSSYLDVVLSVPNEESTEIVVAGNLCETSEWTRHVVHLDSTVAGLHRLHFVWSDWRYGSNPPAAVDNLSIIGVTCSMPENLAADSVTGTEATLSWTPGDIGAPQSYTVAYRKLQDTSFVEVPCLDSVCHLAGLEPAMVYVWKVRSHCTDADTGDWSVEGRFATWATLPYSCDFENLVENIQWQYFDWNNNNRWRIGAAAACQGSQSMYVTPRNEETNTYEFNRTSNSWIYRDVYFEPNHQEYHISFDFKGMGQENADYASVYVGQVQPIATTVQLGVPDSIEMIGERMCLVPDWSHYTIPLDSSYAGFRRLFFRWENNNSGGINPAAAIDNLVVVGSDCAIPTDLAAEVTDTTALLSWNSDTTVSYLLSYRLLEDTSAIEVLVTGTSCLLQGLLPASEYSFQVATLCQNSSAVEWSSEKRFLTTSHMAYLPYECNFEDLDESARWTFVNDTFVNRWTVGGATNFTGGQSLYVTSDSGVTNAYDITSASQVWAYRDFYFDPEYLQYQVSFDVRTVGQSGSDYLKVFVGAPATPYGAFAPEGATPLDGEMSLMTGWQHLSFTLDESFAGVKRLYFLWVNNNAAGENPPAAIDNVAVTGLTCGVPTQLATVHYEDVTATLSWSPGDVGVPAGYDLAYRKITDSLYTEITVSDTIGIIAGLLPETNYAWKVRTRCQGNSLSGWSSEVFFQTNPLVAQIPYVCDFEDSTENARWKLVNFNCTNKWYIGNAVHHGGSQSLYISNNGGLSNAYSGSLNNVVWVYRDVYLDPADREYRLTFDVRNQGESADDMLFPYLGEPVEIANLSQLYATAEAITPYGICEQATWTTKSYVIDSTHSGLKRLYFVWDNDYFGVYNPPAAIDNVKVEGTECVSAAPVLSSVVTDNMAVLRWTPVDDALFYELRYRQLTDPNYTEMNVTDTFCILEALQPSTDYEWQLRPRCSSTGHSYWETATFHTKQHTPDLPYLCDFEDEVENGDWTFVNGAYTNQWYIGNATCQGGANALYVTNDGGTSNAYTLNATSVVWAYRDFYIMPGMTEFAVSFDFKGMGEIISNVYDYARVYVGPPVVPNGANAPAGAVQIGGTLVNISDWTTFTDTVEMESETPFLRFYVLWNNDYVYGTNPPAAIDNISIANVGCSIPRNLAATDIDNGSATLTWACPTPGATFELAYKVVSDTGFTTVNVSSLSYSLSGLSSITPYEFKVRTFCPNGFSSDWSEAFFFTTTQDYAYLPYFCGFEDGGENTHWSLQNGNYTNRWFIGGTVHQAGDSSLYVSQNNGAANTYDTYAESYVWAFRDVYFDAGYAEYQIEFDVKNLGSTVADLRVFVCTPTTPVGASTPVGATMLGTSYTNLSQWTHQLYTLDAAYAGLQRIYFLWRNDHSPYYTSVVTPAAVDNVSIIGVNCSVPINLATTGITHEEATLSWSSGEYGYTDFYTVAFRQASDTLFTEFVTTDTFFVMSGLPSSTDFIWKVRSHCPSLEESVWSLEHPFATLARVAELPYFCDFEDPDEHKDWRLTSAPNRWVFGTAVSNGGTHSLYISEDNGVSNTFDHTNANSYVWAYRDIYFDPGYDEYQICFDHKGMGSAGELTRVFLGPLVTPNNNNIPSQLTELGSGLYMEPAWTSHSFTVDSSFAGLHRLYFYWSNGYYCTSENPPGAIDNIRIEGGSCKAPFHLTADSVDDTSIAFHFTPADSNDQAWQTFIMVAGGDPDTATVIHLSDTFYTYTGLNNNSLYSIYVRTDCGFEQSFWNSFSHVTNCGPVSILPFTENFECYTSGMEYPRCWEMVDGTDVPYIDDFFNPGSLHFGVYNSVKMAVTPEFDTSIPINMLQATFSMKGNGLGELIVGVLDSLTDASSFTPVDTLFTNIYYPEQWISHTVLFDNYAGTGRYIAFKCVSPSTSSVQVTMDNLVVEFISSCPRPNHVGVSQIMSDAAQVEWTPAGDETAWQVVVVPAGTPVSEGVPMDAVSHPFPVGNLSESTSYDVYVRAVCGDSDHSAWAGGIRFETKCSPISQLPYTEDFEDYNLPVIPVMPCWTFPCMYNGYPRLERGTAYSGSMAMRFYTQVLQSSPSIPSTAVTPQLAVELHDVMVRFHLKAEQDVSSGSIEVGVMSDPLDMSTYESVAVVTAPDINHWHEFAVSLANTQLSGLNKHVVFRQVGAHSSNASYWLDDVVFEQIPDCPNPAGLTVTSTDAASATISWMDEAGASSWEVYVCPHGSTPDFTQSVVVNNTQHLFTGLLGDVLYDGYVRTLCPGATTTSNWVSVSFLTASAAQAQIPYFCDFSDEVENAQWMFCGDQQVNQWYIGQPNSMADTVLFVSKDGLSTSYNNVSTASWVYRDIHFGSGNEFKLMLSWKCLGDFYDEDYMEVFIGAPTVPQAGNCNPPQGSIQLGDKFNGSEEEQVFETILSGTYANTTQRLYFLWRNDNYITTSPSAIVNSLGVVTLTCDPIEQLPYSESFDQYTMDNVSSYPDCWTKILTDASYSYYPLISGERYLSAPASLKFETNEYAYNWAIAPELGPSIHLDSIVVAFDYYAVSGWDTLDVGVMADPTDASTFEVVETITCEMSDAWESHVVSMLSYTGTGRYIAFRYRESPSFFALAYMDNVQFYKTQTSLDDHTLASTVALYPNPTTGLFVVECKGSDIRSVEVYDVYGKMLTRVDGGGDHMELNLGRYAPGMYLVRVYSEKGTVTKRVVKK